MRTLFLYESQFSSESLAVRVLPKDEGININFSLFQLETLFDLSHPFAYDYLFSYINLFTLFNHKKIIYIT